MFSTHSFFFQWKHSEMFCQIFDQYFSVELDFFYQLSLAHWLPVVNLIFEKNKLIFISLCMYSLRGKGSKQLASRKCVEIAHFLCEFTVLQCVSFSEKNCIEISNKCWCKFAHSFFVIPNASSRFRVSLILF